MKRHRRLSPKPSESFQDLVAEARSEMMEEKAARAAAPEEPREVTIS